MLIIRIRNRQLKFNAHNVEGTLWKLNFYQPYQAKMLSTLRDWKLWRGMISYILKVCGYYIPLQARDVTENSTPWRHRFHLCVLGEYDLKNISPHFYNAHAKKAIKYLLISFSNLNIKYQLLIQNINGVRPGGDMADIEVREKKSLP